MAEPTKVCPRCAETIKAAAKVCPFCQSRQNRAVYLAWDVFCAMTGLLVIGGLIFVANWAPGSDSDDGSDLSFKIHRTELAATDLDWRSSGAPGRYALTGYLTNSGTHAWRVSELEIRIKDQDGNLVDVAHTALEKDQRFVVPPNQRHALSIQFSSSLMKTNNQLSLRVQRAADGRSHSAPN
jgi:hypothetical protein